MIDQPYERQDIGFSFIVAPLGEIITDPGFKPGEWFVKFTDKQGIFVILLEDNLKHFKGDDPVLAQATKAIFNGDETVVMLFKVGTIEEEKAIVTLLHRTAATMYIAVDSI